MTYTQLQWEALSVREQMRLKVTDMLEKTERLMEQETPPAPIVANLDQNFRNLKPGLGGSGSVTKEQAEKYQVLSARFKEHVQGRVAPIAKPTVADVMTTTPRSLPAIVNARSKSKKKKRPLNKRQKAVKKAYEMVRKGEVEFEGSDEKFISLGNKNFARLVNRLQTQIT